MSFQKVISSPKGLLGTWVKIPAMETMELLAHAGFDFVVIDREHAALSMETTYKLIFTAQAVGLLALVRLPDETSADIQRLLDAGADGLLVPRMTSAEGAHQVTEKMVFAPRGVRGLGSTSRAGRWGLAPRDEYLAADDAGLRIVQLEDWDVIQNAPAYLEQPHVNGVFVGLGDLNLSSGKTAQDPDVAEILPRIVKACADAEKISAIAAASADEAARFVKMGFKLTMVSNDATLFGLAAAKAVQDVRGAGQ